MPTLTINGKKCDFDGKKMILQVADDNGIELPRYCYHPGLSVVASCRICLAEVKAPNPRNGNKLEFIPKLMPTCQTPAADGMEVFTTTPKATANQKQVMEDLLINHPLDCPVCDQAGECKLQDYSYQYGRSESRFQEDKIKQPGKDIGPNVKLYSDRCIMCTRCVRFTREITETAELGVFGRGAHEQIDVFPGIPLDNELSGNVVDLCPVGSLLDKDFLFSQRVWFLSSTPSIDGITASGDNIWIDHNQGQIHRIKPRENSNINQWWITDEVRYGWKFVASDDRLAQTQRQQLSGLIDCTQERACEEAKKGIAAAGGKLVLMVSPMLATEEAYLLGQAAKALSPDVVFAVGPVPITGEDKTFANDFIISAEKCPNSRGVRKALQMHSETVLSFEELSELLADKKSGVKSFIITGNYPSGWVTKDFAKLIGRNFLVLIDTMPSDLIKRAKVLIPSITWAEKEGSFINRNDVAQAFDAAIPAKEGALAEGQIALDLLAACEQAPKRYNASEVRTEMGIDTVVNEPVADRVGSDMVYAEL
ncbi:MAG: (2Fe-2S)-binding protein [Phycisphaeraceae bacterium]|nr:(2Fe-2S)-binding protein [Phycisphaeraceae bacterium]